MRQEISALLDDELEQTDADRAIDAMRRDGELQETWELYHVIGDAMRQSHGHSPGFSRRVMAKLAQEPVVFLPSAQPKRTTYRVAMPLAAAVMGMAAVGWVALSLNPSPQPVDVAVKSRTTAETAAAQTQLVAKPSGVLKEYLVAHQAHAPNGGIQGVAPYVRTVSEIRQGGKP
jgi:sigma-E factor negative regulatory protein RseA